MLVRNSMLPVHKLITVGVNESVADALEKIESNNFLSIPVVDGEKFCGIISKERIYKEYFAKGGISQEEFFSMTKIEHLLRQDIPYAYEDELIEEVADILKEFRIPFVPVLDSKESKKFIGIITHYSIFDNFVNIFGTRRGYRLALSAFDIQGQLDRLTNIISKGNNNIISLVVIDPEIMGVKEIIVRIETDNIVKLESNIKDAGFKILQINHFTEDK